MVKLAMNSDGSDSTNQQDETLKKSKLNAKELQQLAALGVDDAIARQAYIPENQFDYLVENIAFLQRQIPKLPAPQQQVKLHEPWQLELLAGNLDALTQSSNADILEWQDNIGLNIFHYIALSGNAVALESAITHYPNFFEAKRFDIEIGAADPRDIPRLFQQYAEIHDNNPHLKTIEANDQPGLVTGFADLTEDQVEILKYDYPDLNYTPKTVPHQDKCRNTVVHYAAASANQEGIKFLLRNFPAQTKRLWTPNQRNQKPNRAALEKSIETAINNLDNSGIDLATISKDVQLLTTFPYDVPLNEDGDSYDGKNIAILAAEAGNLNALLALQQINPNGLLEKDGAGKSIIHYAVAFERWDVISFVIEHCPPHELEIVWARDDAGHPPEHGAPKARIQQLKTTQKEAVPKAIARARKRIHSQEAVKKDIELLVEYNALGQKDKKGYTVADIAAQTGNDDFFELLLRHAPQQIQEIWNGKALDKLTPSSASKPSHILAQLFSEATDHLLDDHLNAQEIQFLLAFKSEWNHWVKLQPQGRIDTRINDIDCTDLTQGKLLHILLLAKPKSTPGFFYSYTPVQTIGLGRLENYISKLAPGDLTIEQIQTLSIIIKDYEQGFYGPKDALTSLIFNKLKGSDKIQALLTPPKEDEVVEEEPERLDNESLLKWFQENINRHRDATEKSQLTNVFYPALTHLVRNKTAIVKAFVDYVEIGAPRNYVLTGTGKGDPNAIAIHLYHMDDAQRKAKHPVTRNRAEAVWEEMVNSFFDASVLADEKGKFSDFSSILVSEKGCWEGRTDPAIAKYKYINDAIPPSNSMQDLVNNWVNTEYIPYIQTMLGNTAPINVLEQALNFIYSRHTNEACEVDKIYAPNGKIEKKYLEKFLIEKLNYQAVALSPELEEIIEKIEDQIDLLKEEIHYTYNYFYQSRKQNKIHILQELKQRIVELNISPAKAAAEIKKQFPDASWGILSTRTSTLLNALEQGGNKLTR